MSGSLEPSHEASSNEASEMVYAVLARHVHVETEKALPDALTPAPNAKTEDRLESTAFCLDANVFLDLSKRDYSTVVDTLTTDRSGPLVISEQAIIEFWNNLGSITETITSRLDRAIEALDQLASNLEPAYGIPDSEEFNRYVAALRRTYGDVIDKSRQQDIQSLTAQLLEGATTHAVPRDKFADLVTVRKLSKMPPGFRDSGLGDFFVWADSLLSLVILQKEGRSFERIVLLTRDKKKDWSQGNRAHPALVAEAAAATGLPFEIWDLEYMKKVVKRLLEDGQ